MVHFGLIGARLGHSLSPQIHQLIFKELGVEGTYDLLEIPPDAPLLYRSGFVPDDHNHLINLCCCLHLFYLKKPYYPSRSAGHTYIVQYSCNMCYRHTIVCHRNILYMRPVYP